MWPLANVILLCLKLKILCAEESPESVELDLEFSLNTTRPILFKKKQVVYSASARNQDMMDLVFCILLVLALLAATFGVCCWCMSRSDKKLQKYVLALAKRRGRKLDKRQLKYPQTPPSCAPMHESCPVLLADAGIIIP